MKNSLTSIIRLIIQFAMLFGVFLMLPEKPGSIEYLLSEEYAENNSVGNANASATTSSENVVAISSARSKSIKVSGSSKTSY